MDLDSIHLYFPIIILFFTISLIFQWLGLEFQTFNQVVYAWTITAVPCCILKKMDKNCNGISLLDDESILVSFFLGIISLIYLYISYYSIGLSLRNSKNYLNILMHLYIIIFGIPIIFTIYGYSPIRFDINYNRYFVDKMIKVIEDLSTSRVYDYGIYISNLSLNYLHYTIISERDYYSLQAAIKGNQWYAWYQMKKNIYGNAGNKTIHMLMGEIISSVYSFLTRRMYYSLSPVESDYISNAFILTNPVCTYRFGMIVTFIRVSLFCTFLYGMINFKQLVKQSPPTRTIKSSKKKK